MLDEEATKEKELRIQSELFRVLKNYVVQDYSITENLLDHVTPIDVLFEASIQNASDTTWKADLVLMVLDKRGVEPKRVPILVIETKKRKTSRLTQYYQKALKQAGKYAYAVRCPTYCVYDGHTLILMKNSEPFLLGLYQWTPSSNERSNRDFARKLWRVSMSLMVSYSETRPSEFLFHPDFDPWRRSIFFFIKDAFKFRIEEIQGMSIDDFNVESVAHSLAEEYRRMFNI